MANRRFWIQEGDVASETPPDDETHVPTVSEISQNPDNRLANEVLQALSILDLVVIGNGKSRLLKNGDISIVYGEALSEIENVN